MPNKKYQSCCHRSSSTSNGTSHKDELHLCFLQGPKSALQGNVLIKDEAEKYVQGLPSTPWSRSYQCGPADGFVHNVSDGNVRKEKIHLNIKTWKTVSFFAFSEEAQIQDTGVLTISTQSLCHPEI